MILYCLIVIIVAIYRYAPTPGVDGIRK